MITYRELQIKNTLGYFFSSMANIMKLDTSLLEVNQISFINDDAVIHEIQYFKDFDNATSLYLVFNNVDAYSKSVNKNKYLVFAQRDKNKEMREKYEELWDKIGEETRLIKGIEPFGYEKNYIKIKFESDNKLPLNKVLNISVCVIIVGSVFEEKDGKFYTQVHLNSCCLEYDHDANSYVSCKVPSKCVNNSEYGKYLLKKRLANFVTSDFNSLYMVTKQLNIKNRTYHFWNDQINIKNFNPALLKLDKKSSVGASIYYIGYVTKKHEYNINSVNPLYLVVAELDGFIKEKNGSRYLNIA